MTDRLSYTFKDGVAVIKLDDGKANVLSFEMMAEINSALDKAEAENAIVILTGRPGMMSAGFDLSQRGLEIANVGSTLARRLLAFPRPVIMVSTGHSIAMCAFLALACDYAIIAEGNYKIGLNETQIGMKMHNFGLTLGRERLPAHYFNRAVVNAEIFDSAGSVNAGFFDQTFDLGQIDETIAQIGETFSKLDKEAFRVTKLRSQKTFLKELDQAIEDDLDPEKVYAL